MVDAAMAQLVEHILGKDEVPGPNPGSSSRQPRREIFGALVFYKPLLTLAGTYLFYGVVWSYYSRFVACFRTRSEENRFAMPPQSASSLLVSGKASIIRYANIREEKSSGLWFFIGPCLHWQGFLFKQNRSLTRDLFSIIG